MTTRLEANDPSDEETSPVSGPGDPEESEDVENENSTAARAQAGATRDAIGQLFGEAAAGNAFTADGTPDATDGATEVITPTAETETIA